jgi:hypothetical protein
LRFCLSDLVRMKDVPARPQPSALDFGLDVGQQTRLQSFSELTGGGS